MKTFTDGGTASVTDLNAIQDQYEAAFSQWRTLHTWTAEIPAATGMSTYTMPLTGGAVITTVPASATRWIDPAVDFAAPARSVFLRVRLTVITNAVAPGSTFHLRLGEITALSAASGNEPASLSSTSSLSSLATIATPAADAATVLAGASAQFTPVTDLRRLVYGQLEVAGQATATGSRVRALAELQYKQT